MSSEGTDELFCDDSLVTYVYPWSKDTRTYRPKIWLYSWTYDGSKFLEPLEERAKTSLDPSDRTQFVAQIHG